MSYRNFYPYPYHASINQEVQQRFKVHQLRKCSVTRNSLGSILVRVRRGAKGESKKSRFGRAGRATSCARRRKGRREGHQVTPAAGRWQVTGHKQRVGHTASFSSPIFFLPSERRNSSSGGTGVNPPCACSKPQPGLLSQVPRENAHLLGTVGIPGRGINPFRPQ